MPLAKPSSNFPAVRNIVQLVKTKLTKQSQLEETYVGWVGKPSSRFPAVCLDVLSHAVFADRVSGMRDLGRGAFRGPITVDLCTKAGG